MGRSSWRSASSKCRLLNSSADHAHAGFGATAPNPASVSAGSLGARTMGYGAAAALKL